MVHIWQTTGCVPVSPELSRELTISSQFTRTSCGQCSKVFYYLRVIRLYECCFFVKPSEVAGIHAKAT